MSQVGERLKRSQQTEAQWRGSPAALTSSSSTQGLHVDLDTTSSIYP